MWTRARSRQQRQARLQERQPTAVLDCGRRVEDEPTRFESNQKLNERFGDKRNGASSTSA